MQGTSSKSQDTYPDEQYTLFKPLERSSSSEMIYNILIFLDASPLTLFDGAPANAIEWNQFFDEVFASFITYLVADDERIRYLTSIVARKVMTDGSVSLWRQSQSVGSRTFKHNFWRST